MVFTADECGPSTSSAQSAAKVSASFTDNAGSRVSHIFVEEILIHWGAKFFADFSRLPFPDVGVHPLISHGETSNASDPRFKLVFDAPKLPSPMNDVNV